MIFRTCVRGEDLGKTAKDRVRLAPRSLPKPRPRALTAPLPESSAKEQQQRSWIDVGSWASFFRVKVNTQYTSDQSSSLLVTKLPPEIRQQIWAEVLGGHWLHVVRAPKRLLAIKCSEEPSSSTDTRHRCWGIDSSHLYQTPRFFGGYDSSCPSRAASLLSLPLTCRLIYSETIDILYRDNIFDFNHLDTIIYLSRTTLQSRLYQIRHVCLRWYFRNCLYPIAPVSPGWKPSPGDQYPPYDIETWDRVCQILGGITSLQNVEFYLSGPSTELFQLERLLDHLRHITPARSFDVTLPTKQGHEQLNLDRVRYRLLDADGE